jgi:hypothetical protein
MSATDTHRAKPENSEVVRERWDGGDVAAWRDDDEGRRTGRRLSFTRGLFREPRFAA